MEATTKESNELYVKQRLDFIYQQMACVLIHSRATENAGGKNVARSKNTRAEIEGVENVAPDSRGRKCRSGKQQVENIGVENVAP